MGNNQLILPRKSSKSLWLPSLWLNFTVLTRITLLIATNVEASINFSKDKIHLIYGGILLIGGGPQFFGTRKREKIVN